MAVVVCTIYERDDPPVAGGSATPLGTLDRLLSFSAREVLSTHGFNAVEFEVNRHDSGASLIQAGRWMTVAFPAIQTDPVMTVRLGPSHTVVLGEGESDEIMHCGGLGILSLTKYARLLETWHAPSPPASAARGSSIIAGIWHWLHQTAGAIMTRGFEEGQNQPGEPLGPITITFDRDEDSDGNAWVSLAEDRFFETDTNTDVSDLYLKLAAAGDLFLVERPDFDVDAYNSFGTTSFGIDRTSATFGAGKVRIHADPDTYSNILTGLEEEGEDEPYTHVSVEGANKVFVVVADPDYSSGPARYAAVAYTESDDPDMLERVGLEWLRRQHTRTVAREVEITPGDDEANGRYLPWKHLVVGDLITLDAGGIDEDARLIAIRVELVEGAHDTTTEDAHRSLRVVLELNDTTGEEGQSEGGFGTGGGCGCGPQQLSEPTPPSGGTPLVHWDFNAGSLHDSKLWDNSDTYALEGRLDAVQGMARTNALNGYIGASPDAAPRYAVSPSDVVVLTARVYLAVGSNRSSAELHLRWYDSGGGLISADLAGTVSNDGQFHLFSEAFTAPVGAATMGPSFASPDGPTLWAYVDYFYLDTGGSPGIPGNVPGGTPAVPTGSGQWGTSSTPMPADTVIPAPPAINISIADDGEYFDATEVEGALQEVGDALATLSGPIVITDLTTTETDTSKVIHPNGSGGVVWGTDATGGGGAAKSYVTDPGLRPPDTPDADDIEFLDYANATNPTGTPGMTWGNQGSATAAIQHGRLVMNSATSTGLRALLIATPGSGNFSVDAAVQALLYANTHLAAITMLWGTPGSPTAIRTAGIYNNSSVATRTRFVWTTYNTSWAGTTDAASLDVPTWGFSPVFLRVEWDGTNLVFKGSPSGIVGTFVQITSQALGLGRPDYIGLGVNNNGAASATIAAFSFLRFNWTADFDPTTDD